jgi:hypothetical protein
MIKCLKMMPPVHEAILTVLMCVESTINGRTATTT